MILAPIMTDAKYKTATNVGRLIPNNPVISRVVIFIIVLGFGIEANDQNHLPKWARPFG